MRLRAGTRWWALVLGCGACVAAGGQALPPPVPDLPAMVPPATGRPQGLPPTAPTTPPSLPLPESVPLNNAVQGSLAVAPQKRARIEYAGQLLKIEADNSSLNGILREVARVTGMKITGGVTEERVYGTYGPATPSAVLDKLLEGTGANMLLILNSGALPSELVLTQRNGGPTPPGPGISQEDDPRREDPDTPPQLSRHVPSPTGNAAPPSPGVPVPGTNAGSANGAGIGAGEGVGNGTGNGTGNGNGTTSEQSPNGVKTPQQIYEQLLKLQQQKHASPQ